MAPESATIREMFNSISGKYDFLNHFLSFGVDRCWRKKVVQAIGDHDPGRHERLRILDVATGTGDLAIAISKLKPSEIRGIDIAPAMLEIAKTKTSGTSAGKMISFSEAPAESIPFPDDTFDAVTVAFGVRNFEDLRKGLAEMRRVLKPGGLMVILEFSQPQSFPFRTLYRIYSRYFIPLAGRLVSGNNEAYTYLPESAAAFPAGSKFLGIMGECGMRSARRKELTFGIASLYTAEK